MPKCDANKYNDHKHNSCNKKSFHSLLFFLMMFVIVVLAVLEVEVEEKNAPKHRPSNQQKSCSMIDRALFHFSFFIFVPTKNE